MRLESEESWTAKARSMRSMMAVRATGAAKTMMMVKSVWTLVSIREFFLE